MFNKYESAYFSIIRSSLLLYVDVSIDHTTVAFLSKHFKTWISRKRFVISNFSFKEERFISVAAIVLAWVSFINRCLRRLSILVSLEHESENFFSFTISEFVWSWALISSDELLKVNYESLCETSSQVFVSSLSYEVMLSVFFIYDALHFESTYLSRMQTQKDIAWFFEDKRAFFCMNYFSFNMNWTIRLKILKTYFALVSRFLRINSFFQQTLFVLRKNISTYMRVSWSITVRLSMKLINH